MSKKFSFETIDNFDEHIVQSIPNYELLFQTVVNIAPFFLRKGKTFVDLGCSTGRLLGSIDHDGPKVGVDVSQNLLPLSNDRISFEQANLETYSMPQNCSLVTSIFTVQFLDQGCRADLLKRIYDSLELGGAFVWAEKVTASSAFWEQLQTFSYYDFKKTAFSAEDILDKEKSLRSLMQPWTSERNQAIAHEARFGHGEMIWKFHNFECWVYVKEH